MATVKKIPAITFLQLAINLKLDDFSSRRKDILNFDI